MTPSALPIALALADAISGYMQTAVASERDTRLLVPAPTMRIADEVHAIVHRGATGRYGAYHVISDSRQPDRLTQRIRPSGLTSLRLGSFVAIVDPGQFAHIHDSISGSGGSVRVVAFSDEWPWIDNGMEPLRFDGPILRRLLEICGLTVGHGDWEWTWNLVTKGFLPHTRPMSDRAAVLFERVFSHVDDDTLSDLAGVGEKLLFRAGIPRPVPVTSEPIVNFLRNRTALCNRIVARHREEIGLREHLRDTVSGLGMTDSDRVRAALDTLLDGLGTADRRGQGLLSLFGCWGVGDDTTHWKTLDAKKLSDLFDLKQAQDGPSVTVSPSVQRGLVERGTGRQQPIVVTVAGETIDFRVTYRVPGLQWSPGRWELKVIHLRRTLAKMPIDAPKGKVSIQLDTGILEQQGKHAIPLRIALTNNDDEGHARCRLFLCGPRRPSFVVSQPPIKVFDVNAADDQQSNEQAIKTKEPLYLHLFHHGDGIVSVWDDDRDEEVELTSSGQEMASTTRSIDVSMRSDGIGRFTCSLGGARATISIEAQDLAKGAFSLEDEFRNLMARQRTRALRTVTDIFGGRTRTPYWNLGDMDAQARRRSRFALWMDGADGWRPIVTDLLRPSGADQTSETDLIRYSASLDKDRFHSGTLPRKACEVLQVYQDAREHVITEVTSSLEESDRSGHPVYASHPVFVQTNRNVVENLLSSYLKAYYDVVRYLKSEATRLRWLELFVLSHLDAVCHWGTDPRNATLFLVGPWHPLVLAKRFMVQATLSDRAEKDRGKGGGAGFRHLVRLMAGTQAFRWQVGISPDSNSLVPAYATATSDPGWHLAINYDLPLSRWESIRRGIRRCWGLRVSDGATDDGALVTACVRAYGQAMPARRSIGIRVRKGYDTAAVVQSLNSYCHSDEVAAPTSQQFAGGVRVYLEEELDDSVDDLGTGEPPFHIYSFSEDSDFRNEIHPCIHMLPPSEDTSFQVDERSIGVARGRSSGAAFFVPLNWVTGSSEGVPLGVRYEHDLLDLPASPEGVGSLFLRSVALICGIWAHPIVTVRSVKLPRRLRASWVVLRGTDVDPAILVEYVKEGTDQQIEGRTLWGYEIDVTGSGGSYYVLSTVPQAFTELMKKFFGGRDLGEDPIVQLGSIGVAVAGEAFRSSRHALGVLGLVGAVRMMKTLLGIGPDDGGRKVFLLPVDSFASFFGQVADNRKRADLLAVELVIQKDEVNELLAVSACGIESKFVSGTLSLDQASYALRQAESTERDLRRLVDVGHERGSMPERLAFLALVRFGLRASAPGSSRPLEDNARWEKRVFEAIIDGRYRYREARHQGIVVSTEGALQGTAEGRHIRDGLWVRLTRTAWPDIEDTTAIAGIRQRISHLFSITEPEGIDSVRASPVQQEGAEQVQSGGEAVEPSQAGSLIPVPKSSRSTVGASTPTDLEGRVLLGVDESRHRVHWDPQRSTGPLDNHNVMITGSSGKGKTQFVKYLLAEIRGRGANALVLDMKNDFGNDDFFADTADLNTAFVSFEGLPYNPLIPYPVQHPRTGEKIVQWSQHVSGLVSALGDAYGLGVQQQMAVKNAITETLTDVGIPSYGSASAASVASVPDFRGVGEVLAKTNLGAYHRLDPLFALDLFRPEFQNVSFAGLLRQATILDLSQIPSDGVKNALAQLVVLSAHAYFNSQPQAEETRQYLVFDEAHRVLRSKYMEEDGPRMPSIRGGAGACVSVSYGLPWGSIGVHGYEGHLRKRARC